MDETTVKRRGRKKKEVQKDIINEEEPKKINKRGRKVKVVDFKKTENIQLNKFQLEETIILYLPVSLNELLKDIPESLGIQNILQQKPMSPIPYNAININSSNNISHSNNTKILEKDDVQSYNSVENNGDRKITKIYNNTVLPTTKDFNNVRQVLTEKTDVACWWCCHQFDTYPVCAPVKYNEHKDIFTVIGCFCSFNCAKAYCMKDMKNNITIALNSFLYKRITGQLEYIKPAPCKTVLKMFGGPLSITEYRNTFNTLSNIQINVYPMVFMPTQIEYNKVESSFQKYRSSINKGILTKTTVDNAAKRLSASKIKKESSIKKTENNLFNIMGIKIKEN